MTPTERGDAASTLLTFRPRRSEPTWGEFIADMQRDMPQEFDRPFSELVRELVKMASEWGAMADLFANRNEA